MNLAVELDPRYLSILDAANAKTKVGSLTHSFYRYPARFGETFVREAIQQFSREGEAVLDPILFRYEAPALADAFGEATRRDGER